MKVLLVYLAFVDSEELSPYALRKYVSAKNARLSLEYLSAVLKEKEVDSEIIDQSISRFSLKDLIGTIKIGKYLFVGFYSNRLLVDKLIQYARAIRDECDTLLVVGGPGSIEAKKLIENGYDIVCHGEGEEVVVDIVDYVSGRIHLEDIKGISYTSDGIIKTNTSRQLIANLDEIPFPSRDKITMRYYNDHYLPMLKRPYAVMMASRGCPYRCIYCFSHCWWQDTYRFRSVDNVIKEVEHVVKHFGVRYIIFRDDIFACQYEWMEEFCFALIRKNYNVGWMCNFYPRAFPDNKLEEIISLMKKAGCNFIHLGLPSTNAGILKKINRPVSEPMAVENIINIVKKKKIFVVLEFILGLPGESRDSILENIQYVKKVKPHLVNYNPLGIEPLTALERLYSRDRICEFSADEIEAWCRYAMRKFYLNGANVFKFLICILKENPSWFMNSYRFLNLLKHY